MHINRTKLDAALHYLLQLITAGIEYPDAEWRASQKFGVPSTNLRDAYDEHCANKGEPA